jgi:hypothetical protein
MPLVIFLLSLVGVKCCIIVVSICISLMTKNVGHLFGEWWPFRLREMSVQILCPLGYLPFLLVSCKSC